MIKPIVSIVLTSYNHAEYIKKSITSILNQTYRDFELIIVDDNSTDNSREIIDKFAEKDSRIIKVYNTVNSGSYVYSTNEGAYYANGKYLLFAQCDDFSQPNQLEKLIQSEKKYPDLAVYFSSSNLIDENDKFICNDYDLRNNFFKTYCINDTVITHLCFQQMLLNACVIPNLSAALIRRDVYNEFNGLSPDFRVVADWEFWLKVSTKYDIYYIREPLNNFRQHQSTIRSSVKLQTQAKEIAQAFLNFNNILKSIPDSPHYNIRYRIFKTLIGFYRNEQQLNFGNLKKSFELAF